MIFAPRSWPSRPGFAITTRIRRSTGRQYTATRVSVRRPDHACTVPGAAGGTPTPAPADERENETDRRRLFPCVAESRRRPVRLPRARGRDDALRLRRGRARKAAPARELAAGRLDRHLPLAPRPLGRSRPLGLGQHVRAGPRSSEAGALAAPGRDRAARVVRR